MRKKRTFMQLTVNVTGQYYVATRQIQRGETVQLVDIGTKRGLLHKLPAGAVTDKIALRGAIALRNIDARADLCRLHDPQTLGNKSRTKRFCHGGW